MVIYVSLMLKTQMVFMSHHRQKILKQEGNEPIIQLS